MIEINGLTRSFGAAGIFDVGFTGRPGSVTGFLGPNGAGKTTTMRLLCGLDRPDAGTATIDGHPYARLPQPDWPRRIFNHGAHWHAALYPEAAEMSTVIAGDVGVRSRAAEA